MVCILCARASPSSSTAMLILPSNYTRRRSGAIPFMATLSMPPKQLQAAKQKQMWMPPSGCPLLRNLSIERVYHCERITEGFDVRVTQKKRRGLGPYAYWLRMVACKGPIQSNHEQERKVSLARISPKECAPFFTNLHAQIYATSGN